MSEIVKSGKIGRVLSSTVVSIVQKKCHSPTTNDTTMQIGAVPREMFFWGPWVSESNLYTVDATTGMFLPISHESSWLIE